MPPPQRRRYEYQKETVTLSGLHDFLERLDTVGSELDHANEVFKKLAAKTIVTRAKELAKETGRQQARASKDVRAAGSGVVTYGGKAWSFGAEFGALQYKQFPKWRGKGMGAGYFFWPAVEEFRDKQMLELWVKESWLQIEKDLFNERG